VSAIFAVDDLPEKWKHYTEINAKQALMAVVSKAEQN
jgi:hypothetical protein